MPTPDVSDKGFAPSKTDQILDLLLDALIERQNARRAQAGTVPPAVSRPAAAPVTAPQPPQVQEKPAAPSPASEKRAPAPGEKGWTPPPSPAPIHLAGTLARFLILMVALLLLVNVPVTRYGVSLARILPDSASLVIRDGVILKGSGPEIYMLQGDKLRWISSLYAFDQLGLRWGQVHVVEDAFLSRFAKGQPIHVLLKCESSPHIYRLENEQKRWIKDIATFTGEGHVWEDVRFVSCDELRRIPDGPPIPENAGTPPQP